MNPKIASLVTSQIAAAGAFLSTMKKKHAVLLVTYRVKTNVKLEQQKEQGMILCKTINDSILQLKMIFIRQLIFYSASICVTIETFSSFFCLLSINY